jgi:hypothetical protein
MSEASPEVQRPLCFVLMPFGTKPDPTGRPDINFNRVYEKAIKPAIEAADMIPVRADEEKTGGIIHKPMFERLLLCEYAVADLTTANPNVFYELGVRHTARPRTTQPIYAKHQPIPFDVNFLRAQPYSLGDNNSFSDNDADLLREALSVRLRDLRQQAESDTEPDSPVFQLVGEWRPNDIARIKTDMFRDQVRINAQRKTQMALARAAGRENGLPQLEAIERELGNLDIHEAGIVVDLMLSYRALEGWTQMIKLYDRMPDALKRQVMAREQLAFALNRRAGDKSRLEAERKADRERALQILNAVEEQQGANSETCGLIGRIYKDLWKESQTTDPVAARGYLKRAIVSYTRGFQADPRDAFPGINAVTLLDVRGDKESLTERDRLLPVVRYAVERRLGGKSPDYWDYATMLELEVLASNYERAADHLDSALACVREVWEPKTTADNLQIIRYARTGRGQDVQELSSVIAALVNKANHMSGT